MKSTRPINAMFVVPLKSTFSRRMVILAMLLALPASSAPAQVDNRLKGLERTAALVNADQLAEAEQQLSQILKANPHAAAALNLLGTIRAKQGRFDEAEKIFSLAVRSDAQLATSHMNLARLYLLSGKPEKSIAELKEVLRLEPSNQEAGYRCAWLLLSLNRLDECIEFAENFQRIQEAPSALLLDVLGNAYLKKGDHDAAQQKFLLALDVQSDNTEALFGLAVISKAKGDAKTATLYLNRASQLIGDTPEFLYKFARVALNSEMKVEAIAALKRAVDLKPAEPSYHFALGSAWLKRPPDLQEAEHSFRQFLKLQPDNASGQLHLAYVLLKQKRQAESREWLEKSLEKGRATPEAYYYLGLISQEQNEDARAIEFFEKAIQLAPNFASAHIALGSTYLKQKNYPSAKQSLETGVRLSPDDSKAHYNLAMLYARLKNPERSREEMAIVETLKNKGKSPENQTDTPTPPPQR